MSAQSLFDFDPPATHRSDPGTSFEAEHEITSSGARGEQARRVFALVCAHPGLTASELYDRSRAYRDDLLPDLYAVRRRLSDLLHQVTPTVRQGEARVGNSTHNQAASKPRREVTWWVV